MKKYIIKAAKIIRNIVIVCVVIYLFSLGFFYFKQERFFFNPKILEKSYQYSFAGNFEEVNIDVDEGVALNALWFTVPNSKGLIVYYHGNAGAIHDWGKRAPLYNENGYDILFVDYRGYGKSDGWYSSNEQLLSDVQKVYDFAKTKYSEDKIVVLGYSIGSGLAAYIASENNPKLLILNAPYFSWKDLIANQIAPIVPEFLINYDIPTDEFLAGVRCPVKIFHGTRDNLIKPSLNSEKLKALYPEKIELTLIDEASHNTIHISKQYYDALKRIL